MHECFCNCRFQLYLFVNILLLINFIVTIILFSLEPTLLKINYSTDWDVAAVVIDKDSILRRRVFVGNPVYLANIRLM